MGPTYYPLRSLSLSYTHASPRPARDLPPDPAYLDLHVACFELHIAQASAWTWNRFLIAVANEVATEAATKEVALKKQRNAERLEVTAAATAVYAELDTLWKGELAACTLATREMTRGHQAAAAMARAAAAKERLAQHGQAYGQALQVRHLPFGIFSHLQSIPTQPYPLQGPHQEERQRRDETSRLNPRSCSAESAHTDRIQRLRQKAVKLVGNFSDRTRNALSPQGGRPASRTNHETKPKPGRTMV